MELLPLTQVMDESLSESASDNKTPNEAIDDSLNISHNFTRPFAYPAMTLLLKTEAAYKIPPGKQAQICSIRLFLDRSWGGVLNWVGFG